MPYETAEAAEERIHDQVNTQNIALEQDAGFYTDAHIGWHPLKEPWAKAIKPLQEPEPKTVGEICMLDCKEREKNRKRECAEIRKRVQQKLKEIGCPSKVTSTDKAVLCGGVSKKSKTKEKETTTKKKKASKKKA